MCRINIASINTQKYGVLTKSLIGLTCSIGVINAAHGNRDGFGIFTDKHTWKSWQSADVAMRSPSLWEWVGQRKPSNTVISHVRQATVGRNIMDSDMSHPFVIGQWVGAHNGHFVNWNEVKTAHQYYTDQMDSQVFFRCLVDNIAQASGLTMLQAIQKTVDEFVGPFVFVLHDNSTDGTYLIIGQNRTLFSYQADGVTFLNTDGGLIQDYNFEYNKLRLDNPQLPATTLLCSKLAQDSVYYLENSNLTLLGGIKSVPEVEKEKKVTVTTAGGTNTTSVSSASNSSKNEYTISGRLVKEQLQKRLSLMRRFGLTDTAFESLVNSLYPLMSGDLISMSDINFTHLSDFLGSLDPRIFDEMELKHNLWAEITKLATSAQSAETICFSINSKFESPYFVNPVELLEGILEEVK